MRNFNVTVDGKSYSVQVDEVGAGSTSTASAQIAVPAAAPSAPVASAPAAAPAGGTAVKAPMPGMVVKFKVENGAVVKKDQAVVVLEAMKMENDIAAPCDGIFTAVAAKGATVASGDILATIK